MKMHWLRITRSAIVAGLALPFGLAAELLTLDQAIQLAVANNRSLHNASTEVNKARARAAAERTHLYPAFQMTVMASQLVTPIDFTLERGLLGNFPGTGPIPANDVKIRTPLRPTGIFMGSVSQPLTSLYRLRMNLKLLDLNGQLAQEQERAGRQDVVRDAKHLYYSIQQAQSSLRSAEESVKLYREAESLTARYLDQQVVLKGDLLQVQTQLARAEQSQTTLHDQIDSGKEQLNHLMGRDVLTAFDVSPPLDATDLETDAEGARRRALAQRPEIRQAKLKLAHADQDRRAKKAESIPDSQASFDSLEVLGFNSFLPLHLNSVRISVSWEPFDWGRRKHELAEKDGAIIQARNNGADTESKVLIEVNDAFRKLRESRGQLRVARLAQATAEENLRVVQEKFQQQSSLMKDVLQAQTSLAQTTMEYRQALVGYWTAKADFERAMGEDQ